MMKIILCSSVFFLIVLFALSAFAAEKIKDLASASNVNNYNNNYIVKSALYYKSELPKISPASTDEKVVELSHKIEDVAEREIEKEEGSNIQEKEELAMISLPDDPSQLVNISHLKEKRQDKASILSNPK